MTKRWLLALLLVGAFGCSSGSKGGGAPTGPHPDDETWADGKQITGNVVIATGATVTIAPGASIHVANGATITVQGKLQAQAKSQHAKLAGDAWGGIVVSGGALDLEGVDLTNAATAISVQSGMASYRYGTVANSTPFRVEVEGQLTVAHSAVTGSKAPSAILGDFTATFMDYEAGPAEAILAQDPGATLSLEDSTIHGIGNEDNDLVAARSAASIHVAYVELTHAHCGFHFDSVGSFDVSFVSVHDGAYGMMLYGSSSDGTRTVTNSNIFGNHGAGIDEGNPNTVNGVITISDGYWANNGSSTGDNIHEFTGQIRTSNMSSTTQVSGTGPRGAVP
jgi:hypothetical protein